METSKEEKQESKESETIVIVTLEMNSIQKNTHIQLKTQETHKLSSDDIFMLQAIALAKEGEGKVEPNPKVGAILVRDDVIIGQGYHANYGGPHAEIEAIRSCQTTCEGATLYVTLEPCNHHGKTPPCTEAIIANGIKRVVVGGVDPNPLVAGKGIKHLKEHGIAVELSGLQSECEAINKDFIKVMKTGFPLVALKYAMTLDGKIATQSGHSKWITNESSRQHVHGLRQTYQGIMVGIGTVLKDDPMLNVRYEPIYRQPIRIVVDTHCRMPLDSKIIKSSADLRTYIAVGNHVAQDIINRVEATGAKVIKVGLKNKSIDLKALLNELVRLKIYSVFVEGGASLHGSFKDENLIDEVHVYIAPKMMGGKQALSPVLGEGISYIHEASQLAIEETLVISGDIYMKGVVMQPCLQD